MLKKKNLGKCENNNLNIKKRYIPHYLIGSKSLYLGALKVFEFFGEGPIKVAHCKKAKERRSDILV